MNESRTLDSPVEYKVNGNPRKAERDALLMEVAALRQVIKAKLAQVAIIEYNAKTISPREVGASGGMAET